jgi:integrase
MAACRHTWTLGARHRRAPKVTRNRSRISSGISRSCVELKIPAAHGQRIKFEDKLIDAVTKADVEAIRDAAVATPRLHFHDLRREFGSRLLESGASQHIVRDFLGHANISTTSRYLATTPTTLEAAMRHFDEHRKDSHMVVTSSDQLHAESHESKRTEVVKQ